MCCLIYYIILYYSLLYHIIYICINIILIFPCTHLEITSTLRHHWACCRLPKVRRRYSEILLVHEFLSGQNFMSPKLVWNDPKKCLVKSWPIGWQWSHRFDAAFVADMISDLMISHVGYADKLPAFPPKAFQSWSLLFGESLPVQHLGLWQWPVTETLLTFSWQLRYVWVGLDGFALRRVSAFQEFLSSIIVLCRYREAIGMWTWEDTRDDSEANQHYTSYYFVLQPLQPSSTQTISTLENSTQTIWSPKDAFSSHGCTLRYFRQLLSRQDVVAKPRLQQLLGVERPPPVTASVRRFCMGISKHNFI